MGLRAAAETLNHRGPDAFGEWTDPEAGVYLAHCRLSIIDLSPLANQPMANEDGRVQVVFNGEIYNFAELRRELAARGHHFRSQSDTEVIVHGYEEWGADLFTRLRGIFAIGVWDVARRELCIARDRLGIKPLYYSVRGGEFAFASEPRALLAIPEFCQAASVAGMVQFLQYTYTTGAETIWSEIRRFPQAQSAVFDLEAGTLRRREYWRLPEVDTRWTTAEALDRVDELLKDAVEEELVSDVPVGVFLSGGVDSSLISSYAAERSPEIQSFCVDFVGWEGSEVEDSRSVARHLSTRHTVCPLDPRNCRVTDPEVADRFFPIWDEPMGDLSVVPTWELARVARESVTVAMSGDGGDELFAGYNWYDTAQPRLRRRLSWAWECCRRAMGLGREWPMGCAGPFEYYHFLMSPNFSCGELRQLFPAWAREIASAPPGGLFAACDPPATEPIRRWQLIDAATFLVDNNLARVDRASMTHGLEVRVPLLDHRLVEFAFSLPDGLRCRNGMSKYLLRELTRRYLPQKVWMKPKQGFTFPLNSIAPMRDLIRNLDDGTLLRHELMDRDGWERWKAADPPARRHTQLWLLYVLDQWAGRWMFRQRPNLPASRRTDPGRLTPRIG
jgi:asparagine synthase (glutamine-hydrolysing)